MTPVELIKNSVASALTQDGYTAMQAQRYADDAALFFRTTTKFQKGAYADCLAHARKIAKQGIR